MSIVLGIHNLLRWLVLFAALFVLFRMVRGLITNAAWEKSDRTAGIIFSSGLDLQLLVGLLLYFVFSPMVKSFFSNFSAAIQNPNLRYWGFDHIGLMLAAVVLGHLGSAVAKKEISDRQKFRNSLMFYVAALVFLLLGIPWFRPLLPF